MADEEDIAILRERAAHARVLASAIADPVAVDGLVRYAEQLEGKAQELDVAPVLPDAAAVPSGEPPIAHAGAALKAATVQPKQSGDSANDNSSSDS